MPPSATSYTYKDPENLKAVKVGLKGTHGVRTTFHRLRVPFPLDLSDIFVTDLTSRC